jgi:S-adenosylmethionine synthetase
MQKSNFSEKENHIFFASESVGEGHPDKLCDQISDGILDAALRINPNAKVAMETATKSNLICLLGETSITKDQVDFEQIAREVTKGVGFTSEESGIDGGSCDVIQRIEA